MEESVAITKIQEFLGQSMRLSIKDGRTFTGRFMTTDRDANIILQGSEEARGPETRFVGMVCVPGREIIRIEICKDRF